MSTKIPVVYGDKWQGQPKQQKKACETGALR